MLLKVRPAADSPIPVQRVDAAPPGRRDRRSPTHPVLVTLELRCQTGL